MSQAEHVRVLNLEARVETLEKRTAALEDLIKDALAHAGEAAKPKKGA